MDRTAIVEKLMRGDLPLEEVSGKHLEAHIKHRTRLESTPPSQWVAAIYDRFNGLVLVYEDVEGLHGVVYKIGSYDAMLLIAYTSLHPLDLQAIADMIRASIRVAIVGLNAADEPPAPERDTLLPFPGR
jgi:hypothetical protein